MKKSGYYEIVAKQSWTGGDVPTEEAKNDLEFRLLRSKFFRESVRKCGGLDLWKFTEQFDQAGRQHVGYTTSMERARIFWHRASYDAWRTLN